MEIRKLLTIFVVFVVVLATMSTVIEAQRGGMGSGMGSGMMGGHGGHHGKVNAGSDNNNVGDNNNAGAIDVYVSTDKRRYTLGEQIGITVTAYNPNDFTITLEFGTSSTGGTCQASYTIDGISPAPTACDTAIDNFALPPGGSVTWTRTHTNETFPLSTGIHSIVGKVFGYVIRPIKVIGPFESDPVTIRIVEPDNSGM